MSVIYITGIPGVGKSSLIAELNSRGYFAFDIDSICSWVNKVSGQKANYYSGIGKDWIKAHNWLCDIRALEEIIVEHKDNKHLFFAGVTSNQKCYLSLFDKIILLQCGKEIFLNRLATRENNEYGKDHWERQDILSWYERFETNLVNKSAIIINANQPIGIIVENIVSHL